MDDKTRKKIAKDKVVSSMAKKLADVAVVSEIEKSKKKRNRKPVLWYLVSILFTIVATVFCYLAILSTEKIHLKQFKEGVYALQEKKPINKLKAELNEQLISPDQFARYCKDLLIRFDSLPAKYKSEIPFVSSEEVYREIAQVWYQLRPQTRQELTKMLPQLSVKVEHYMDSLGLH
jgi:hypothetical protein